MATIVTRDGITPTVGEDVDDERRRLYLARSRVVLSGDALHT